MGRLPFFPCIVWFKVNASETIGLLNDRLSLTMIESRCYHRVVDGSILDGRFDYTVPGDG